MREIQFRGRDDSGKWQYGNLVRYKEPDGEDVICIVGTERCEVSAELAFVPVDEKTVGQFTGLIDKQCRDIYEGDIIRVEFIDGSGGNHLIGWNEKFGSFGCMNRYELKSIAEGYDFAAFNGYVLDAYRRKAVIFEVVGNIHDNPELMESNLEPKAHLCKVCGNCGYFMRYVRRDGTPDKSGDCGSIGMNKECYEGVNPFNSDYTPILHVEENEDACGFFNENRTERVRKYIKAHPKIYVQKK